jgi:hypothetical protein
LGLLLLLATSADAQNYQRGIDNYLKILAGKIKLEQLSAEEQHEVVIIFRAGPGERNANLFLNCQLSQQRPPTSLRVLLVSVVSVTTADFIAYRGIKKFLLEHQAGRFQRDRLVYWKKGAADEYDMVDAKQGFTALEELLELPKEGSWDERVKRLEGVFEKAKIDKSQGLKHLPLRQRPENFTPNCL